MNYLGSIGVFLMTITLSSSFDGCAFSYGRRGCTDRIHEGVLVTCNGNADMTTIPDNIPSDTVLISLHGFNLQHLQRANFTRFKLLECLNIFDSDIAKIDEDTFSDTTALHELNLQGTMMSGESLSFLSNELFTPISVSISESEAVNNFPFELESGNPLERITSLRLNDNGISNVEANILRHLDVIATLSLSNNHIREMDWHVMKRMINLNELRLDNNYFQGIPERASQVFHTVNTLTLGNNPLHCNCKLLWLKDFYSLSTGKTLDEDEVYCASPMKRPLMEVDMSELLCSEPSMPELNWMDLGGGRAAVNCSAHSDPAPTLTMLFPNGQKMITPPSSDLSKLTTSTNFILTEPGTITCISSNTEGASEIVEQSPDWGKLNISSKTNYL